MRSFSFAKVLCSQSGSSTCIDRQPAGAWIQLDPRLSAYPGHLVLSLAATDRLQPPSLVLFDHSVSLPASRVRRAMHVRLLIVAIADGWRLGEQ
jgi:hypothetical protein